MKKNSAMSAIIKVNDWIGNIERYFCVVVLILLVIACMIFILCRYVLFISTPWADELARYVLISLGWVGASYCTYHDDHLRINAVSNIVKKHAKNAKTILTALEMVTQLLLGLFMAFFLWNFTRYLTRTVIPMNVLTTSLRIKNWYPMLVIPFSATMMVIHSFLKTIIHLGTLLNMVPVKEAALEVEEG